MIFICLAGGDGDAMEMSEGNGDVETECHVLQGSTVRLQSTVLVVQ